MENKKHVYIFLIIIVLLLVGYIVYSTIQSNKLSELQNTLEETNFQVESGKEKARSIEESLQGYALNTQASDKDIETLESKINNTYTYTINNYNIEFDKDSLELISITNTNRAEAMTSYSEQECTETIKSIYKAIGLSEDYDLAYINQFDEQLVEADFYKKREDLYNEYESVKILFSPVNSEIISLTVMNKKYTDDEGEKISKEEAIKIAEEKMNTIIGQDTQGESTSELKIVLGNDLFDDSRKAGTDVKNLETSSMAWVITKGKCVIYINAFSGEIIGGKYL